MIEEHCRKFGSRSALILHIVVGLLLSCTTLLLMVWGIVMFCIGSRTARPDTERSKPKKLQKKARLKAKASHK